MDHPGGLSVIPRGPKTGPQESEREGNVTTEAERFEGAMLLALRLEDGVRSPRIQVASRSSKRQEIDSPLKPPKGSSLTAA